MDALIDLSWRAYPAAFAMAIGAWLALRGIHTFVRAFQPPFDGPQRSLAGVRGFRRGIGGLALVGLGAAWIWQIDWILVLSLVIGGEELLESTFHVQALSIAERNERNSTPRTAKLAAPITSAKLNHDGLRSALIWQGPRPRRGARL
ncbi:MAG: hypothetical protein O6913_08800 [Chloroflexi bacterium]|nr:hypothetical protein [Chloroflexota bacterium]MCZ6706704.1 hypothetical protein [Chloroflexota bacterium]